MSPPIRKGRHSHTQAAPIAFVSPDRTKCEELARLLEPIPVVHVPSGADRLPVLKSAPSVLVLAAAAPRWLSEAQADSSFGVVVVGPVDVGPETQVDERLPENCSMEELARCCRLLARCVELQRRLQETQNALDEAARQKRRWQRQLRPQQERLRRLAATDSLTGTWNRRSLLRELSRQFAEASRQRTPLSLLIVDVDYFKSINDQFGHPIGDQVLCAMVQVLRSHLRQDDFLGRLGGDEFALLLPGVTAADAWKLAERLRERIAEKPLSLPERQIPIHVSVGLSTWPDDGPDTDQRLLEFADRALIAAKRRGRAQSCTYDQLTPAERRSTSPQQGDRSSSETQLP